MKKIEINKNLLRKLYCKDKKSLEEIGKYLKCCGETIRANLIKLDITRRPRSWNAIGWNKGKKMSKKQRELLSETHKRLHKEGKIKPYWTGKHLSLEHKKKLSAWRKGKFRGKDNHQWKGGSESKYLVWRRRINKSLEYRELRKEVYKRDGYRCILCHKESNGDLQMHHILPVREYPELILDKMNCITLCKKCHSHIRGKEKEYRDRFKNNL